MVASVCAAAAGANHVWQTRSVAKATALETIDRKRIGPRSMRFDPSRNRCMVRMPTLPDVLAYTSHEKCQPAYINRANLRELIGMPSYGAPEIRREVCAGGAFCRRPGTGGVHPAPACAFEILATNGGPIVSVRGTGVCVLEPQSGLRKLAATCRSAGLQACCTAAGQP